MAHTVKGAIWKKLLAKLLESRRNNTEMMIIADCLVKSGLISGINAKQMSSFAPGVEVLSIPATEECLWAWDPAKRRDCKAALPNPGEDIYNKAKNENIEETAALYIGTIFKKITMGTMTTKYEMYITRYGVALRPIFNLNETLPGNISGGIAELISIDELEKRFLKGHLFLVDQSDNTGITHRYWEPLLEDMFFRKDPAVGEDFKIEKNTKPAPGFPYGNGTYYSHWPQFRLSAAETLLRTFAIKMLSVLGRLRFEDGFGIDIFTWSILQECLRTDDVRHSGRIFNPDNDGRGAKTWNRVFGGLLHEQDWKMVYGALSGCVYGWEVKWAKNGASFWEYTMCREPHMQFIQEFLTKRNFRASIGMSDDEYVHSWLMTPKLLSQMKKSPVYESLVGTENLNKYYADLQKEIPLSLNSKSLALFGKVQNLRTEAGRFIVMFQDNIAQQLLSKQIQEEKVTYFHSVYSILSNNKNNIKKELGEVLAI